MAVGQNPVYPVNIPIPTKIGSKMAGAPTPKWDPIGFDPQPNPAKEDLQAEKNANGEVPLCGKSSLTYFGIIGSGW